MKEIGFIIILPLVIIANVLWYWLKFDLKKHGYETHMFWGHFTDLVNASRVIRTTEDKTVKRTYTMILGSLIVVVIGFLTTAFNSFPSIDETRCNVFDSYLSHSYSGQLKKKFVDLDNHAVETLILINGENESTVYMNLNQKLYEFIEPGDLISKQPNDSAIIVKRGDETYEFIRKRGEFCR